MYFMFFSRSIYGSIFGSDLLNKSSLDELFPNFFLSPTKQTYLHVLYLCIVEHIAIGQIPRRVLSRSVQFSHSVVSKSLRPHELEHARPPCPSPTPGVHSDSHPLSLWCHPAISSSVVPFSSCPQSLPASESFSMSQLFAWGGQSTGVSALASLLPKNTKGWSPLEWTGVSRSGVAKSSS